MEDKSEVNPEGSSGDEQPNPVVTKLKEKLDSNFANLGFTYFMTDSIPSVLVPKESLHDLCQFLNEDVLYDSKMLSCMAGVDYIDYCQIFYVLYSIENNFTVGVKCNSEYGLKIPTVSDIWKAADWYEREIHDLYGIEFDGNEDMSPLLLYDGFEGYPGKKDFPFYDYQEY